MYIDPRGILRTATAIRETAEATYVTHDCGHTSSFNACFHYELGSKHHCFACGQAARLECTAETKLARLQKQIAKAHAEINQAAIIITAAFAQRNQPIE